MMTTTTTTTGIAPAATRVRGGRRGGRRAFALMLMVVALLGAMTTCVVGVAAAADGNGAAKDSSSRPRARFQRLNDRASLGGWKKIKKSAKKTTKKVVDSGKKIVEAPAKTLAEKAKDAYDAGKALAGSTYKDTWNKVKNKFGAKADAFVGNAGDMLKNKYDKTKGFSDSALSQVKSEASQLAQDTTAIAEMIVAFFNGLRCDISPSTMTSFTKNLIGKVKAGGTNDLVQKLKSDPKRFYQDMDAATCDLVWNTLFTAQSAAVDVFFSAIDALKRDCPAIAGGSVKPAFTQGFTFGVDVAFATRTAGIGTEIGIGVDVEGNKFCYVGACVVSGRTFGPNPNSANAEPGLAISGFKSMSSVAGECSLIDAGIEVNLPSPIKVQGSTGLTYLYGSGLGDFIGVQYPMSLSNADPVPGAEVSFSKGMCCAPICVKTTGGNCAPTNWKNPCPTVGDPNAWANLITAASGAALGGEQTLDRRHEEFPYRRMGGASDADLGDVSHERSIVTPALTVVVAAAALAAIAVQFVVRRRNKLVADETTPLIRPA